MPKLSASLLEDLQRSSGHHQIESFPQTHEAVSPCFLAESAKALQLQLATAESAQDIANARAFQQALTLPEYWLQVASCRTPNLCIYIYIYSMKLNRVSRVLSEVYLKFVDSCSRHDYVAEPPQLQAALKALTGFWDPYVDSARGAVMARDFHG